MIIVVLYELSFPIYIFIFPVILVLVFLVLPKLLSRLKINEKNGADIEKIQYFGCIIALTMIVFLCITTVKDYYYIEDQYSKKNYFEIVGYVENFSPLNDAKNQQEKFSIGEVTFSYGFAGKMNFVGYQKIRGHGGIVEGNGQYLKIRYIPYHDTNIIVFIEQE